MKNIQKNEKFQFVHKVNKMIQKLTIRTKFILLGAIGSLALITIVILALNISKLGLEGIDTVYKDSKNVQTLQHDYIAPVFQLRELSLSLVVAPNDNFRKQIKKNLNPLLILLDDRFKQLDIETQKSWNEYKKYLKITTNYIDEGFEEGAFINVNQDERKRFYSLVTVLQKLQSKELTKSSNTYVGAKNIIDLNRFSIITVSIVLSIFNLLLGSFIIIKIARSVEEVKAGLGRFFYFLRDRKNVEGIVGITLDTSDELGDMAKAINTEIEKTKIALKQDIKLIESATNMVEEIKNGNLNSRLEVSAKTEELNQLKLMINAMVNDLEMKIQEEIGRRTDQEKLLIQQSKLAAMGNMIGNIAHQWRQPLGELNAILMNIETRYKFNQFDENFIENSVIKCNKITTHMSNTINDFQNFFKPSKTKEVFNVVESCKKASSILKSSLKHHNIDFQCNFDKQEDVFGYPNEFSQAFLNILSNAKDVLIQRNIKSPFIKVNITSGKQYILIKVEDNGGGIEEKNLQRIFEPYFTTKHAKQGTGIGLYMSKMIIEDNMDGFLNAQNLENGASFTIKLKQNT